MGVTSVRRVMAISSCVVGVWSPFPAVAHTRVNILICVPAFAKVAPVQTEKTRAQVDAINALMRGRSTMVGKLMCGAVGTDRKSRARVALAGGRKSENLLARNVCMYTLAVFSPFNRDLRTEITHTTHTY